MTYLINKETIQKIAEATQDNEHTISVYLLAKAMNDDVNANILKKINEIHELEGHMPEDLANYRQSILESLLAKCEAVMQKADFQELKRAF